MRDVCVFAYRCTRALRIKEGTHELTNRRRPSTFKACMGLPAASNRCVLSTNLSSGNSHSSGGKKKRFSFAKPMENYRGLSRARIPCQSSNRICHHPAQPRDADAHLFHWVSHPASHGCSTFRGTFRRTFDETFARGRETLDINIFKISRRPPTQVYLLLILSMLDICSSFGGSGFESPLSPL